MENAPIPSLSIFSIAVDDTSILGRSNFQTINAISIFIFLPYLMAIEIIQSIWCSRCPVCWDNAAAATVAMAKVIFFRIV